MYNEALFYIATGAGNGLYTLRQRDGIYSDGSPKCFHVRTLCRDPKKAVEKARSYIQDQGYDVDGVKDDRNVFEDNKILSVDLTKWGECSPERFNQVQMAKAGIMPFGKYYNQKISDIDITYFVNYIFDQDIDTPRKDLVKESIREQLLLRKAEFAWVASENAIRKANREAREAKRLATAVDVPEGKIEVSGEIVGVKFTDSQFGGSFKMIVESDEGYKLYGTIPNSLLEIVEHITELKGKRVQFNATVFQSSRDSKFGFFKRPTKSKIQ
jgi:hypothetical protein